MQRARSRVAGSTLALAALSLLAACNAIFGFEERTLEPCSPYCSAIMQACTDDDKQYESEEVCRAVCADLLELEADASVDPIACRSGHVDTAASASEAETKRVACRKAGLSGADVDGATVCSDRCELYCGLMSLTCKDRSTVPDVLEDCKTLCQAVPANPTWTQTDPALRDHDDSIECRFWHLGNAALEVFHCSHADGTSKCDGDLPSDGGGGAGGG
jgi:hypothetical protein